MAVSQSTSPTQEVKHGMSYQPWTKELERELIHLCVQACYHAKYGEAKVGNFHITCSKNGRPCVTEGTIILGKIVFTNYPGQKKVINKRICLSHLLPALRNHPPLVLERLAHL